MYLPLRHRLPAIAKSVNVDGASCDNEYLHNPGHTSATLIVTIEGDKFNFGSSVLNNVNGPAISFADGTEVWVEDGVVHRDGRPAIVNSDHQIWVTNGEIVDFKTTSVVNLLSLMQKVFELMGLLSGPIATLTRIRIHH